MSAWQEIAQSKREAITALLPVEWRVQELPSPIDAPDATRVIQTTLSEREIEITERLSVSQLLKQLSSGELSAEEVTAAFCHRATVAHQLTNCLSEVLFVEALSRARELDAYYKAHGKPVGPLHGLPISLKDQFRVCGAETSMGYVSWLGPKETAETESWLVSRLRELGAVFHCKTNVPTSLMAIETNNNIIGYTTNAYNRMLSSGGSSGGEASLLALRGSPIGLGSDVGASIRVPCAFSNLVGLKPSHGRTPYLGLANSMEGHTTVESVVGPMGHNLSDLRLVLRLVLDMQPWLADPKVIRLPWRQSDHDDAKSRIETKSLVFGVMRTDGFVDVHPPVRRAMDEAVAALEREGHKMLLWEPPSHAEAFQILWDTFAADGGTDIHEQLRASGEPPVPELAVAYGEAIGHLPVGTINDLWATQRRKYAFQVSYAAYWQTMGVDAVICPTAPSASYRKGEGRYFGYTGAWNVLDYAVAVVRTRTTCDAKLDAHVEKNSFLNDSDKAIANDYDADMFHGMPIGLQVVCGRLEEEKVLAIAEEVERVCFG